MEHHEPGFVLSSPTEESLPAYSTTWGYDVVEKQPRKRWAWWRLKYGWLSAQQNTAQKTKPVVDCIAQSTRSLLEVTWKNMRERVWPLIKAFRPSLTQLIALCLLLSFGVLPLGILGYYSPIHWGRPGDHPFYGVFQDKVLDCGSSFDMPKNATVTGVEKIFVLDKTFGHFSFAFAKSIDVAWDIIVGRGVQLLAWWIGYVVFSDALLRAIERHSTSFQIFQRIALEGPSLLSLWTLIHELWRSKSKRTKALFFYMWISTLYIMCIPMFLGAMTGYDSTSIAWVSLDNDNNIVATHSMVRSGMVIGTLDEKFDEPACLDYGVYEKANSQRFDRRVWCDCQLRNGTVISAKAFKAYQGYNYWKNNMEADCRLDFPNNNQTFKNTTPSRFSLTPEKCASSYNLTVSGKTYDAINLDLDYGYCYNAKPYKYEYLRDRTRCLPDTSHPSYEWGFSTMISAIFVFIHFGWAVTMYVVWQDAQFASTLVKTGYRMTPLRAAFAMAKVAGRRTGMGEKQLVRANTRELEQELYGTRRREGTCVEYGLFGDSGDEGEDGRGAGVRKRGGRRSVRPKFEVGVKEMEMSIGSASSSKPGRPV